MGVSYALQTVDSYTVLGGMLLFGLLLLVTGAPLALLAFWLLNAALLTYTQRAELCLTLSPEAGCDYAVGGRDEAGGVGDVVHAAAPRL